jgi:hypothetical protein
MNRINFAPSRQVVSGLAVFIFLAAAVAGNACTFLLPATEGAGDPRFYAFFFAAGLVADFDFGFAADFAFVSALAFFSAGGT